MPVVDRKAPKGFQVAMKTLGGRRQRSLAENDQTAADLGGTNLLPMFNNGPCEIGVLGELHGQTE
jgi:hypothetical protein